jgi:hypothetical protein
VSWWGLAQVSIAALTFVFGFVTVIGSYVMKNLEKTRALQHVLVHFFRLMPPFLLGEGLIELTAYHFERSIELASAPAGPQNGTQSGIGDTPGRSPPLPCRQTGPLAIQGLGGGGSWGDAWAYNDCYGVLFWMYL